MVEKLGGMSLDLKKEAKTAYEIEQMKKCVGGCDGEWVYQYPKGKFVPLDAALEALKHSEECLRQKDTLFSAQGKALGLTLAEADLLRKKLHTLEGRLQQIRKASEEHSVLADFAYQGPPSKHWLQTKGQYWEGYNKRGEEIRKILDKTELGDKHE